MDKNTTTYRIMDFVIVGLLQSQIEDFMNDLVHLVETYGCEFGGILSDEKSDNDATEG
jgi:hypothetical protein